MGARRKSSQKQEKRKVWVNSGISWTVSEPERDYRNKPAGIKALADMIAESEEMDAADQAEIEKAGK